MKVERVPARPEKDTRDVSIILTYEEARVITTVLGRIEGGDYGSIRPRTRDLYNHLINLGVEALETDTVKANMVLRG